MTSLERLLHEEKSLTLARYMELALTHPHDGYYTTGHPIGAKGDFVTAPEVSQLFGELLGLWVLDAWEKSGAPSSVTLIELGPGRGTLMRDVLRVGALRPAFLEALQIHLVEVSPTLQETQKSALSHHSIAWFETLEPALRETPTYFIANEFFDALPIHQYIKTEEGWHERMVTGGSGALSFGLSPLPVPLEVEASLGSVYETCPQAVEILERMTRVVSKHGGGAIIADYGYREGLGDTLQGVKDHDYCDVLSSPGSVDLTAHVNFGAFHEILKKYPSLYKSFETQGDFLKGLGIDLRTQHLKKQANPSQKKDLDQALHRLTASSEMGELFKVLTFWREEVLHNRTTLKEVE